ncbi:MAG: hypothetical protein K5669_07715 [Lachnospiraceae bacterium]|nr:hypothetical protein [Lachnospiraceae bacterium]
MANININVTKVKKQAQQLKEASYKLQKEAVKPLEESNEKLKTAWTGEAATSYVKSVDEIESLLKANAEDIKEIAVFLEKAAQRIENADKTAKTKVKR